MDIDHSFASEGPLSKVIDGYALRKEQLALAQAVAHAIRHRTMLVAEAATGTGKTFAYLVPALLSGKRTLISTGTKHLQDQLFFSDLPKLTRAFALFKEVAYLKGRANYICLYRLRRHMEEGHFFSRELASDISRIYGQQGALTRGDINEIKGVDENAKVWPYVTSTVDNCLGSECDFFKDCYIQKARNQAAKADVLVINHHLFFADSLLKEEGFTDILPNSEIVVFDEAHQLPETATHFFGERLSSRQLRLLCEDIEVEITEQGLDKSLAEILEQLRSSSLSFAELLPEHGSYAWYELSLIPEVKAGFLTLHQSLLKLKEALIGQANASKELANCYQRAHNLSLLLKAFAENSEQEKVRWVHCLNRGFQLLSSVLSVSEPFQALLVSSQTTYIFTSATLAVGGSLTHFKNRLGLDGASELVIGSPYHYQEQALIYMPRFLPEVTDDNYIQAFLASTIPVVKLLAGRSLLLFTSYRAMHQAYAYISDQTKLHILMQGDKSKSQLLNEFKANANNTVLLATSSFWEGVDIKGSNLSLVAIDKLPFESPYEPVIKAKLELIKKQGGQPFHDYQLPNAVIAFKQGIGRLIRDSHDKGILVLGDARLYGRTYGAQFLKSVPNIPKTRSYEFVVEFAQKNLIESLS